MENRDRQIQISASLNRAATIIAHLAQGKRYEDIAKDVYTLGKMIYEYEVRLNEETLSPNQQLELSAQGKIKVPGIKTGMGARERKEKNSFEARDEFDDIQP